MYSANGGRAMSYKTVLVHIDDSAHSAPRVELAAAIARADGGHLIGVALTGVSRLLYQNSAPDDDPNLALHLRFLRERAGRALAGVERLVAAAGLASFELRVVDDEAGAGVSLLARYADLVVIGQIDPRQPAAVDSDFPANVVLHSGRPVLLQPYALPQADAGGASAPARTVLIAWNASREASRAVSAAMPLLRRAGAVHIAVLDTELAVPPGAVNPGADVVRYLARHGVHASTSLLPGQRQRGLGRAGDVGDALLSHAADLAAGLLVMGAYGHARWRETILGGVTRTVLESMTLPVLMAH